MGKIKQGWDEEVRVVKGRDGKYREKMKTCLDKSIPSRGTKFKFCEAGAYSVCSDGEQEDREAGLERRKR